MWLCASYATHAIFILFFSHVSIQDLSAELERLLEHLVRSKGALELDALCLVPQKLCWVIYVDVMVSLCSSKKERVKCNLFLWCRFWILEAICSTWFLWQHVQPSTTLGSQACYARYFAATTLIFFVVVVAVVFCFVQHPKGRSAFERRDRSGRRCAACQSSRCEHFAAVCLTLQGTAVAGPNQPRAELLSLLVRCKIGSQFVVDTSLEEECCLQVRLSVGVNRNGAVCALQKGGGGGVEPSLLFESIKVLCCSARRRSSSCAPDAALLQSAGARNWRRTDSEDGCIIEGGRTVWSRSGRILCRYLLLAAGE